MNTKTRREIAKSLAVVKLPVFNGEDWLMVRTHPNRTGFSRLVIAMNESNPSRSSRLRFEVELVLAYLVDWSFTYKTKHRIAIDESSITALTPDAFKEVVRAIRTHSGFVVA